MAVPSVCLRCKFSKNDAAMISHLSRTQLCPAKVLDVSYEEMVANYKELYKQYLKEIFPFVCEVCDIPCGFSYKKNMNRHFRSLHPKVKIPDTKTKIQPSIPIDLYEFGTYSFAQFRLEDVCAILTTEDVVIHLLRTLFANTRNRNFHIPYVREDKCFTFNKTHWDENSAKQIAQMILYILITQTNEMMAELAKHNKIPKETHEKIVSKLNSTLKGADEVSKILGFICSSVFQQLTKPIYKKVSSQLAQALDTRSLVVLPEYRMEVDYYPSF